MEIKLESLNDSLINMRTIIIEDEEDAQSLLQKIINEYCSEVDIIGHAKDVKSAISLIQESKPDFILLDIQITGGTGFEVLDSFTDINFDIIFTTAYEEYALKAFDYEAIHYLLKPYSPKTVIEAINRIKKKKSDIKLIRQLINQFSGTKKLSNRLAIHSNEGIEFVEIDRIIRLEADRSYCSIYIEEGQKLTVSKPLRTLSEELAPYQFFRSHESHLINLKKLKKYINEDGGYLLMMDDSVVPLARRRKAEILKIL